MFEWRRGLLSEKVVVELIGEIELRALGPPGRAEEGSDEDILLVPLKGVVGI